mgnify:CR=1 FL=1
MDVVSKKKGFMSKKITNDKKDFFPKIRKQSQWQSQLQ